MWAGLGLLLASAVLLEVRTEYLASSSRGVTRGRRGSIGGVPGSIGEARLSTADPIPHLSEGMRVMRDVFPRGLPPRLLVLGKGGMGKTVLTKQLVVELGTQLLRGGEGVVPALERRLCRVVFGPGGRFANSL